MDKVDFKGRILIQNCISAKLQLNWDQINSVSEQSAEFVTVENALVIYVCFKDSLYTVYQYIICNASTTEVSLYIQKGLCSQMQTKQLFRK